MDAEELDPTKQYPELKAKRLGPIEKRDLDEQKSISAKIENSEGM